MNALGISLVWTALQVTLFCTASAAIYFVARRWAPACGASLLCGALVMTAGIAAASLSPWPCWSILPDARPASRVTEGNSEARAEPLGQPSSPPTAAAGGENVQQPTSPIAPGLGFLSGIWGKLHRELGDELRTAHRAARFFWPVWLAAAVLAGVGIGSARMLLAWLALTRLLRGTRAVTDASLLCLLDELRTNLCCRRGIELREMTDARSCGSPAVVGWRRPVILLPADWRSWSLEVRRGILAHESAHVAHGDFLKWLAAQAGVIVNFYNPLVQWLAARLRLEQELAADAVGAEAAGGREAYLFTLAQMALREDDRRIAWAARPFFPARGTFLRRIDMLRYPTTWRVGPRSAQRRLAFAGLLAAAGLLIAGLRGPGGRQEGVAAAAPPEAKAGAAGEIDFRYLPDDAALVWVVRPAELFAEKGLKPMVDLLNEPRGLRPILGLRVDELEEVQFAMMDMEEVGPRQGPPGKEPSAIAVLKTTQARDWKKTVAALGDALVEAAFAGRTYYKAAGPTMPADSYFFPDERTMIVAPDPRVQQAILASGKDGAKPAWAAAFGQHAGHAPISAMVDVAALRTTIDSGVGHAPPQATAIATMLAPLWQQSERLFVALNIKGGLSIDALAACPTAEAAAKVRTTAEAGLTLARNALDAISKQAVAAPGEQSGALLLIGDVGTELVKQSKLEIEGTSLRFRSSADVDAAEAIVSTTLPAVLAARGAAQRAQAMNNLKQIELAMFIYHDQHNHFPPAVVLGPDGKTPHSWRVELLPHLEQEPLYNQYKMDEPWDSENNKKVLAQMPAVFRDPSGDPNSLDTFVFVLTGDSTMFPADKAISVVDVTDGTSNTIMTVEAKRTVPWTKPEDIAYDPARPMPKLGGLRPGGFLAGFGDGSVRFITETIGEQTLRALFTRAGGEAIQDIP